MFVIELNTLASKKALLVSVRHQMDNLQLLTQFEGQVFVMFCLAVGGDRLADTVARELLALPKRSEVSWTGDNDIAQTAGTLQHDAGGGNRVVRSSKGLS